MKKDKIDKACCMIHNEKACCMIHNEKKIRLIKHVV